MTNRRPASGGKGGRRLPIKYEPAELNRTILVDGAWGGPTLQGGVLAVLYTEHQRAPSASAYVIEDADADEGWAREDRETKVPTNIVRELQAELRMTPTVARTIGAWLIQKADLAEEQQAKARERAAANMVTDSSSDSDATAPGESE